METPPKPPRSGFATPAAVEAGKHIGATKAAVDAALPLDLTKPSQAEKDQGVVVCFERREPDGWQLKGQISRGPSGLLLSRLEVFPPTTEDAPHGITTRFLQRIPVEKILDAVRAHAAYEEARQEGTRKILGEEPIPGVFTKGDSEATPPRKNAVTEDLLREVAQAYLQETAAGMPTGALKRLSEQFDRPEKTIQRWISLARKSEWLGPGARGRSGAEPGPRLMIWQLEETKRLHPGLISHVLVDKDGNTTDVTAPGAYEEAQRRQQQRGSER